MTRNRIERDSLGEIDVPAGAYYGAQTARAVANFPISGVVFSRRFIRSLGIVKRACARANIEQGRLERRTGNAIVKAATEVVDGLLDGEFVVDVFQTGSGTSTNMNANEVIANRAAELLGRKRGGKSIHPNDHVNLQQSSNDVIPTAIHVAAATAIHDDLIPALKRLHRALAKKAKSLDRIVKSGRTHLMDATPIRLGQEFGGYARQIEIGIERAVRARDGLLELALGGTAVGTGINRTRGFPKRAIAYIRRDTGVRFVEAADHVEAQGAKDACVEASGQLKTIACSMMKIAGDLRLLSSGPRTGIAEIELPAVQPGSSIMPGKVNPVMCEAVTMVAAQVMGNDVAIAVCGMSGLLELNVMMPVLAYNLLQSIELLSNVAGAFTDRCVSGIRANAARCESTLERNLAGATALAPRLGYDQAARLAREAFAADTSIREVVLAKGLLTKAEVDELLDYRRMTEPD